MKRVEYLRQYDSEARSFLHETCTRPVEVDLGELWEVPLESIEYNWKTDEYEQTVPLVFPEYKTEYPDIVVNALGELYAEYNRAFAPLVEANREWETDYQYCFDAYGNPINYFVQIDMLGLMPDFLDHANDFSQNEIREALRSGIFEIENSLAMYQLLQRIFSVNGEQTIFDKGFRQSLDDLRQRFGMPIALLAVTDDKYLAMKTSEFGKYPDEPLTDEDVFRLSGFDAFFSPDEFVQYVEANGGECPCLLYARTSDPVIKLIDPKTHVEIPLLEDENYRKLIRAHSLTFNIDKPGLELGAPAKINDTKEHMLAMGMGYLVESEESIFSEEHIAYLYNRKQPAVKKPIFRMNPNLAEYLSKQGFSTTEIAEIADGKGLFRLKPEKTHYGCYGHVILNPFATGKKPNKYRHELRTGLDQRGPYLLQPELQLPLISNTTAVEDQPHTFTAIDRNFMSFTRGYPNFLCFTRSLMPINTKEAMLGRNHGSSSTHWAEII